MQTGLRSSMCTQAYDAETHFLARGDEPPFSAGSAGLFSTAGTVSPVAAVASSLRTASVVVGFSFSVRADIFCILSAVYDKYVSLLVGILRAFEASHHPVP